jgi:hypothetical protein
MAIFVAATLTDQMNADKRRHPAIFAEAPSSGQQGLPQIDFIYLKELQASASSSAIRKEQLYSSFRDQLLSAAKLQKDWDSYSADAPTPLAINAAERALEILRHLNAEPAAVLPSADGGVGICFNNGGKYGQLEFLNNGEAHALLYGGVDGPQAWQIDLTEPNAMREAWKRVSAYL